ncbi:MAG: hypothetical protein IJP09_03160 [Clostridia bacterium]|nr:hypothetical protein [Clostridia bacterium]
MNNIEIEATFNEMLSLAKVYFENFNQQSLEFHQCLVLRMTEGENVTFHINSDSIENLNVQISSSVMNLKDSAVKKIVCMWKSYEIDVPSFQFMKKLCESNIENRNAEILLNAGQNVYVTKKISDIIG